MTIAPGNESKTSPWLTVWFKPGDTIERVLAGNPRGSLLLLAGLGMASSAVGTIMGAGFAAVLLDWRFLAMILLGGFVGGVILLYVNGLFFGLSGRLIGGRASQAQMRAALAWGLVPSIVGLVIWLAALIGLAASGSASQPTPGALMLLPSAISPVTGLWTLVATVLMVRRVQAFGVFRAVLNVVIGSSLGALLIAMSIRTFLFQPFNIPASSMVPTVLVGDYIFVAKYSYGYSRYSLPFSPPLFSGRIFASEPQRGDVVVFNLPKDDSVVYIKRVVGLPGDRVQMINGLININGKAIDRERAEDFVDPEDGSRIRRWREILPNGVSYYALDLMDNGFLDNTQVFDVPPGHYLVLGDHLDNSTDSRVLSQVGYVPFENLVGRAEIIFFSIDPASGKEPTTIRYERIGTRIR
jgi:signal peptidase I